MVKLSGVKGLENLPGKKRHFSGAFGRNVRVREQPVRCSVSLTKRQLTVHISASYSLSELVTKLIVRLRP